MKTDLFLDLDGVVFNTVKTIVDMYNDDFMYYKNFVPVSWWEVDSWEFEECKLATSSYIMTYFNQPRFFNTYLNLMPFAREVIKALETKYNIFFVSMGEYANLQLKRVWLQKNFPEDIFYPLSLELPDKSCIDMKNGIFIDDSSSNLRTCNAQKAYCYGEERSWNRDWDGKRLTHWTDVYKELF